MPTSIDRASAGEKAKDAASHKTRPLLRVRGLSKFFKRVDKSIVPAVDDVSLDVYSGEFVVLLGPSGCGKTTLLRCIAGLERPDQGSIEISDDTVYSSAQGVNLMPEDRHIGMVFQSYALWPHMTVFENVAYPLRARKVPVSEIAERVQDALRLVGIPEQARQFPAQMSGGQQQRVALARAIVARSRLVLFDEPLSNVDAKVREQLRGELIEMQRKLNFAAVYVTHDQVEAMSLAHRVAALQHGKIAQIGTPRELYLTPQSQYVANFVGTTNTLNGVINGFDRGMAQVVTAHGEMRAIPALPSMQPGSAVAVVFRPERCGLSVTEPADGNKFPVELRSSIFLGAHTEHLVGAGEQTFQVWTVDDIQHEVGMRLWLSAPSDHFCAVPGE